MRLIQSTGHQRSWMIDRLEKQSAELREAAATMTAAATSLRQPVTIPPEVVAP